MNEEVKKKKRKEERVSKRIKGGWRMWIAMAHYQLYFSFLYNVEGDSQQKQ